MLKNLLSPILLATTFAIALPAQAQVSNACGMSYMILPDGNCLDLDYTSILGASRRDVSQATAAYEEVFEANVTIETIYALYPQLDNETEAEYERRIETLLLFRENRDDAVQSGQNVEDTLYPIHVYSMHEVGRAYQP
ncbi:hypothetical protein H6F75_00095 [Nodosilinea sp. FACHB-131]|uniref:hypothetical protein n=1 Tax=Cyanophyceae TaxID=3028117 RepID=UPI001682093A|nr:hypothetical protein [Nodosilinea sp. FACHB-131]MBD1871870.1 hypothetical protein [Nodosilinea sp. FACHB-131]